MSASAVAESRVARIASIAPTLFFLAFMTVLPLVNLFAMSFFEVEWAGGAQTWTPVGLDNYFRLASDALFRAGLWNTAVFVVAATSVQVLIGLVLALLCSSIGRHSVVYRTIFLLPILVPGIIIGAIWRLMYNHQFGIINQSLKGIGLGAVDWLGSPQLALLSVIIVDIWHWTPFSFLLLLAAVENLPEDIYEAARIDGATAWQQFRRITLPLLMPAIVVTFIFRAVIAFKVFDEIYLLTGGGPGTATEVISFTIYQRFFIQDDPGYGSAMSIFAMFIMAFVIIVGLGVQNRAAER